MSAYDRWKQTDPSDDGWQEAFTAWLDDMPREQLQAYALEWMETTRRVAGTLVTAPQSIGTRFQVATVTFNGWDALVQHLIPKYEAWLRQKDAEAA